MHCAVVGSLWFRGRTCSGLSLRMHVAGHLAWGWACHRSCTSSRSLAPFCAGTPSGALQHWLALHRWQPLYREHVRVAAAREERVEVCPAAACLAHLVLARRHGPSSPCWLTASFPAAHQPTVVQDVLQASGEEPGFLSATLLWQDGCRAEAAQMGGHPAPSLQAASGSAPGVGIPCVHA